MMKPAAVLLALVMGSGAALAGEDCHDVTDLTDFLSEMAGYDGLPDCIALDRAVPEGRAGLLLSQAGAYDPVTDRISLAQGVDPADPLGRSTLLHELVHMAQFRGAAADTAPCIATLEAEAYALQAAWLNHMGEGREAFLIATIGQRLGSCQG